MTWSPSQRRSMRQGRVASAARHLLLALLLVSQLAGPFFHHHAVGHAHLGWHASATITATDLDQSDHADHAGHPLDTLHVMVTAAAIHHMDAGLPQLKQHAWRTPSAIVPRRWTFAFTRLPTESPDTPEVPLRAIFRTPPPANRGPPQSV